MSQHRLDKYEFNRKIKRILLWAWNFWPPFLGSGIRVLRISPDFKEIDVKLVLGFWNANYVGTAFGGSLFALTDPFFMVMLYETLGPGYIVWDKAAKIEYLKPGKSNVYANFRLSSEQIDFFKQKTLELGKYEPELVIEIKDKKDQIIARVTKTLYIRKK